MEEEEETAVVKTDKILDLKKLWFSGKETCYIHTHIHN